MEIYELDLTNFEEMLEDFLKEIEKNAGSQGYAGFMVYDDNLDKCELNFSNEIEIFEDWLGNYDNCYVLYSYNLEDEDLDLDYIEEQVRDTLTDYLENLRDIGILKDR